MKEGQEVKQFVQDDAEKYCHTARKWAKVSLVGGSEAFVFKTPLLVGLSCIVSLESSAQGEHVPTDLSAPSPQQFVVKEFQWPDQHLWWLTGMKAVKNMPVGCKTEVQELAHVTRGLYSQHRKQQEVWFPHV